MVIIWIVELWVLSGVEFNSEQGRDCGMGGVGEEAKVLTGEGAGRRHGAGEDEGKTETWAGGDLGQNGENEGSGEGRNVGGV